MSFSLQSLKTVGPAAVKIINRGLLYAKKYSPQILTAAGIISGIAATVVASIKSTKLKDIIEQEQEEIDNIRCTFDKAEGLTEQAFRKDLTKAYFRMGGKIVKLYWPAAILTVGSVTCILVGHGIMTKRAAALATAYAGLANQFESYRKEVTEKLGVEEEKKIFINSATEETEEVDSKTGQKIKKFNDYSQYCKIFDEFNDHYSPYSGDNFVFLKGCQNMANDLLHTRGHVFLNEVYTMLGFQHTKAGAVCGWLDGHGDNFVDFGIFDRRNGDMINSAFINGDEKSIILDFNVDGPIYNLLGEVGYH